MVTARGAMEEVVGVMEQEAEVEVGALVAINRRRRWTKLLALRYSVLMLLLL